MFFFFAENILDSRLIEQFERSNSSTSASDNPPGKRGPKPKASKDKKSESKSESNSDSKEAKKPAFLLPTASGRTPKVATRYEEKPPEPKKPQEKSHTAATKPQKDLKDHKTSSEPPAKKIKRESSSENEPKGSKSEPKPAAKLEPKSSKMEPKKEEIVNSGESDSESEDDDEDEGKIEYTEWFPPDTWTYLEKVFVTDVTVDDVTVTMRESKTPEGFFNQATSV